MAGGPLFPSSAYPVTADKVFANVHQCAAGADGTNVRRIEGLGVAASLTGAPAYWEVWWRMPSLLPAGSPKLILAAVASATSGIAKVNPQWAMCGFGVDPSGLSLNAEGETADVVSGSAGATPTIEWGAGDADQILQAKWTLDAASLQASQWLAMLLKFNHTGWTLAAVSTWVPAINWE